MEPSGRYENPFERGIPSSTVAVETKLLPRAREAGFSLVQYETDTGQLVFEWRRGNDRGPQFLTRQLALVWLVDELERRHDILDIPNTDGQLDGRIDALRVVAEFE
jgi:hypothetical protein